MAKTSTIKISLTDFIDFINKKGGPKQTLVRQIKTRDDYAPHKDFYKELRDRIILTHTTDKEKKFLDGIVKTLTD